MSSRAHVSGSRLKNAKRIISYPVFSVFWWLFIFERRQVRIYPFDGERTKLRGFVTVHRFVLYLPSSSILPRAGEAPRMHGYIRRWSRCDIEHLPHQTNSTACNKSEASHW